MIIIAAQACPPPSLFRGDFVVQKPSAPRTDSTPEWPGWRLSNMRSTRFGVAVVIDAGSDSEDHCRNKVYRAGVVAARQHASADAQRGMAGRRQTCPLRLWERTDAVSAPPRGSLRRGTQALARSAPPEARFRDGTRGGAASGMTGQSPLVIGGTRRRPARAMQRADFHSQGFEQAQGRRRSLPGISTLRSPPPWVATGRGRWANSESILAQVPRNWPAPAPA